MSTNSKDQENVCACQREKLRGDLLTCPFIMNGRDGDLVSAECTGKIKVRRFMKDIPERDLMRFWCYMMEWTMIKLAALSRKHRCIASMVQVTLLQSMPRSVQVHVALFFCFPFHLLTRTALLSLLSPCAPSLPAGQRFARPATCPGNVPASRCTLR